MRLQRRLVGFVLLLFGLSACSGGSPSSEQSTGAVRTTDLAILPCGAQPDEAPCVLVMAGGKRVLLGAPAGVAKRLGDETLEYLDAVMLFSLRADDIEGLDEVRNQSWLAGRSERLKVAGPDGTADVIAAINKAYEVSDAELFVARGGAGGFDAPMLITHSGAVETRANVFDTGDLQVTRIVNAQNLAGYIIDYADHRLVVEPCEMSQAGTFAGEISTRIDCDDNTEGLNWPISELAILYRETEN